MMEPIDWFLFVESGQPQHVSIARIHADLCALVRCSSNLVRMDHHYALKCARKHRLTADHFHLLPEMLRHGRIVADKPRHLTFFYFDYITYRQWFQATIKTNEAENELWVVTFHAASDKDVRRKIKKYGELT
jgi:hypothetical protein